MRAALQGDRLQWLSLCRSLVDSARLHAASDGATIDLPGSPSRHGAQSDGLEGFSRVFLTYAFGAQSDDSPFDASDAEGWRRGIAAGLQGTPGERRWPEAAPKGHSIVDAGYIALALRILGRTFVAPLSERERELLFDWLEAHAFAEPPANNWVLFRCAIASALRHLEPTRSSSSTLAEVVAESYSALDDWYDASTGWYSDGDARTVDYYNSFELHFLPALLAHLDDDAEARQRHRQRLSVYLPSLRALIDREGVPVYFGRSLTYRFAIAAPFALGAMLEVGDEPPERSRQRLSAVVRAFLDRGAVAADGTLQRGWFSAQPELAQEYSGPASAYFASRVFVALLLPAEHRFWHNETVDEQPPPREALTLPRQPNWLIDPSPDGAVVRLINHGSTERVGTIMRRRFDDPLYSRLAYSSATAPAEAEGLSDRSITLMVNGVPCSRGVIVPNGAGDRWVSSWSHPRMLTDKPVTAVPNQFRGRDLDDLFVHHLTALVEGWQVDVTAVVGTTSRVDQLVHGGWSLADPLSATVARRWGRVRARVTSAGLDAQTVALRAPRASARIVRSTLAQPFGAVADFSVIAMPARFLPLRARKRADPVLWMVSASRLDACVAETENQAAAAPRFRGRLAPRALFSGITLGRGSETLRIVLDESGLRATT